MNSYKALLALSDNAGTLLGRILDKINKIGPIIHKLYTNFSNPP